jgi:hypothetical protein
VAVFDVLAATNAIGLADLATPDGGRDERGREAGAM